MVSGSGAETIIEGSRDSSLPIPFPVVNPTSCRVISHAYCHLGFHESGNGLGSGYILASLFRIYYTYW